jgi:hypothetical protein
LARRGCLREELNEAARLVTDNPRIVAGKNLKGRARANLALGAIIHEDLQASREHVADVGRSAGLTAEHGL